MYKIYVFSDSHGFNEPMLDIINHCDADYVVHCGDFCASKDFMDKNFNQYVYGNNDLYGSKTITFEIDGIKFLLTHGHQQFHFKQSKWHENLRSLGKQYNVDVVLYGHSHVYCVDVDSTPFVCNPGSIALPRNKDFIKTYLIIEIENKKIKFIEKKLIK